jgi:hypothetical protein
MVTNSDLSKVYILVHYRVTHPEISLMIMIQLASCSTLEKKSFSMVMYPTKWLCAMISNPGESQYSMYTVWPRLMGRTDQPVRSLFKVQPTPLQSGWGSDGGYWTEYSVGN